MLAEVKIESGYGSKIAALEDEAYHEVREGVPFLDLPMDREKAPEYRWQTDVIDLTREGAVLTKHGVEYVIKRFKACRKVKVEGQVNIQVAIPNLLLFSVNEVTWLEDACTEDLQKHLDNQWRILAVCPAENSRRPTYILGRNKDAC